MDLHTHFAFGIAIGLMFFGHPDIAFIIGLGTLLPDLDREYWFIGRQAYRDEQYHRALFHNVFFMASTYLISPFLSLGVFLHILLDSFTTVKDRGCEWFYPISRWVKRGLYDADGHPETLDPKEDIYFFQEDPHGLVDYAEIDLQEEGPVPWRRVYGPAQNSHLMDRGFLYGSVVVVLIWLFAPDNAHYPILLTYPLKNCFVLAVGFLAIVFLFVAGELDRKDAPVRIPKFNFVKYPIFVAGVVLFVTWIVLYWTEIVANLYNILSYPITFLLGVALIPLVSLAVIKWQTRPSKTPAIV